MFHNGLEGENNMEFQVIYFSKTGNTMKLAYSIASELKIKADDVKYAKLKDDVTVFLGSGSYGGKPAKSMIKFIIDNNFKSRNVALFGTSGSGEGKEVQEMENILKNKGAYIKVKFFCKGKFLFTNRGRPNENDLNEGKKFAKYFLK